MTLSEEISPYIDKETGMITAPDGGRDNLILGVAHLISMLTDEEEKSLWRDRADAFLISVRVKSGLFRRYPNAEGNNSVDNLIAAAFASQYSAEWIYIRGSSYHWCFNVENPDAFSWRYWYARFIGFPPFIKMAAGEEIGIVSQVLWSIACVYSAMTPVGNTSDKLLQHLMNRIVGGRYWLCDRAVSLWRWLMARKYQNGIKSVYEIYYGPDFPITKHAREDFS